MQKLQNLAESLEKLPISASSLYLKYFYIWSNNQNAGVQQLTYGEKIPPVKSKNKTVQNVKFNTHLLMT